MTEAGLCPHCHSPLVMGNDRGVVVYICCGRRESGERLVEEYEQRPGERQLSMRREHWWGAA